jgi:hypothetical protein
MLICVGDLRLLSEANGNTGSLHKMASNVDTLDRCKNSSPLAVRASYPVAGSNVNRDGSSSLCVG